MFIIIDKKNRIPLTHGVTGKLHYFPSFDVATTILLKSCKFHRVDPSLFEIIEKDTYTVQKCQNKDCKTSVAIPPWFKPFAGYCDKCRPYAIEKFKSN